MRTLNCLIVALIYFHSAFLHATELRTNNEGIEIDASSLGTFQLSYPQFIDKSDVPSHPIIEVQLGEKKAIVLYADGAICEVRIAADEIEIALKNVPTNVKAWKMNSLIDIGFAAGGSWTLGDTSGKFPVDKPQIPQIASLHAKSFSLKNAQGQSLTIAAPENSFQQLTDNREWNWAIFNWQFFVPYHPDHANVKLHIDSDLGATVRLVDQFGQSIAAEFPNKVHTLDELMADVAAEKVYFESLRPPKRDRYGGLDGSKESLGLKKSGYFHIERKTEKHWLVDPDGNAFFHLGVCCFAPGDDFTYVKGREGIYSWLPKVDSEFATAFRSQDGDQNFSFHVANMIRKYGKPYSEDVYKRKMIERVRRWGFNSIGAFTDTTEKSHADLNFPYVAHLPTSQWQGIPRIPGAYEVWDPYDPSVEEKIAENFRNELPQRANDPLLIGWFIVNEPRYDDLYKVIPSLGGSHACKRRFVDRLKQQYVDIGKFNKAWNADAKSFDALIEAGLAVGSETAKADVDNFVGEFLEKTYTQIATNFRKYNSNHLLLGSRLQPITIKDERICKIMGNYVDVMSYNYYTYGVDAESLKKIHQLSGDKPILLSEFFWASSHDSGLIGGREVDSQRQRGLAYRNYVEQTASLGFVIGIEWFTLVDQATTGRWFSKYNGESYNTGLISVADRPWKEMVEEMAKTNYEIYDVLLGNREPFRWMDSRFQSYP